MKNWKHMATGSRGRATLLAGIIFVQAFCALVFAVDVIADLREGESLSALHFSIEALAAFALVCGVVFLAIELRALLARVKRMDQGLMLARGQMAGLLEKLFGEWGLTLAERDVAIMILKGLDNEAIAQVRSTAPGTVRAQTAGIYAKSNTNGRAQFISLLVEELMAGELVAD